MKYSTSLTSSHSPRRDKSDATRHRKSLIADGDLVQDLWAFGWFQAIDGKTSSVVRLPINIISSKNLNQGAKHPKTRWNDLEDVTKGLFCQAALKTYFPHVFGFTLKLSAKTEATARAMGKHCRRYLTKRLREEISRSLRRAGIKKVKIPFWFELEEDRHGILHIHGVAAFDPAMKEIIRKGLDTGGGKWRHPGGGKGYTPVRFETNPDFRWAGYSLKDYAKSRARRRHWAKRLTGVSGRAGRTLVAGFEGPALAASPELVELAKRCHQEAIRPVLANRTGLTRH